MTGTGTRQEHCEVRKRAGGTSGREGGYLYTAALASAALWTRRAACWRRRVREGASSVGGVWIILIGCYRKDKPDKVISPAIV